MQVQKICFVFLYHRGVFKVIFYHLTGITGKTWLYLRCSAVKVNHANLSKLINSYSP